MFFKLLAIINHKQTLTPAKFHRRCPDLVSRQRLVTIKTYAISWLSGKRQNNACSVEPYGPDGMESKRKLLV